MTDQQAEDTNAADPEEPIEEGTLPEEEPTEEAEPEAEPEG